MSNFVIEDGFVKTTTCYLTWQQAMSVIISESRVNIYDYLINNVNQNGMTIERETRAAINDFFNYTL